MQTISSSQTARNLSSQNMRSLVAKAEHADHVGAACLYARPAGRRARHPVRRRRRRPSSRRRGGWECPSGRPSRTGAVPTTQFCCISLRRLADGLDHEGDRPRPRSKSAIVSGMRSPCSCSITMTNWPGLAARAIAGWRISSRYVTSEKILAGDDLEVGHVDSGVACAAGARLVHARCDRSCDGSSPRGPRPCQWLRGGDALCSRSKPGVGSPA